MRTSRCNLLIQSPTGSGKTFAICEAARLVLDSSAGEILYVAEPLIALAEQVYNRLGGEREARCALRTGPSRRGGDDESRVVVCTYEVLARICLSSPQRLDCCSTIVIDEIHYIASDRGPVIQEILQATQTKNIVALSGTLPNKAQFARFLSSLNGLPTYIAGADTRPVPLSFSVYDVGSSRCMAPISSSSSRSNSSRFGRRQMTVGWTMSTALLPLVLVPLLAAVVAACWLAITTSIRGSTISSSTISSSSSMRAFQLVLAAAEAVAVAEGSPGGLASPISCQWKPSGEAGTPGEAAC